MGVERFAVTLANIRLHPTAPRSVAQRQPAANRGALLVRPSPLNESRCLFWRFATGCKVARRRG